ncbi:MAG: sulfur transferase domain-containing protein, partial [Planctomycetota bacterium]|nr:sulfur transferase domain-containing protein [Planctomycetota bacterium]
MSRLLPVLLVLAALTSCSQTVRQERMAASESECDCCSGMAGAADLPAWVDAPNFQILTERVAASGPPTLEAVAGLRERGYGMVIDLRTAQEPGQAEERAAAEAAGLRYVHIPVAGSGFDLTDAARLRDALASAPDGKVLLHCRSGGRVGALWGLAQGFDRGLTPNQAAEVAKQSGRTVSDPAAARVAEELTTAL